MELVGRLAAYRDKEELRDNVLNWYFCKICARIQSIWEQIVVLTHVPVYILSIIILLT